MPFILINKEAGWTSHDVVGYLRKVTRLKKIGHAGTLDPFATGLLIVGIGRDATKRLDEFKDMHKVYEAVVHLGAVSDTYDGTGVVVVQDKKVIEMDEIKGVLSSFLGPQEQIAPMYSAKKVGGEKLYDLARKGIEVERKPHHITIYDIELLNYTYPLLKVKITCSPGTYIRTFAHDLGQKLAVGAYCEELKRTNIGVFGVDEAVGVKELTKENWEGKTFMLSPKVDKSEDV